VQDRAKEIKRKALIEKPMFIFKNFPDWKIYKNKPYSSASFFALGGRDILC
jgi:hypothetical protein